MFIIYILVTCFVANLLFFQTAGAVFSRIIVSILAQVTTVCLAMCPFRACSFLPVYLVMRQLLSPTHVSFILSRAFFSRVMSSSVLPAVGSSRVALPRPAVVRPGNVRGSLPGSRTELQASPVGRYLRPSDVKRQQSRAVGKAGQDHRGVIHLDPASYRHSRSHNLCVQLLEDGYHESFVELFELFQLQRGRREGAEPGSAMASEPLVEEDSLKLDQLRTYLTSAEASQRIGQWGSSVTVHCCNWPIECL